jgi:hypothetical protein
VTALTIAGSSPHRFVARSGCIKPVLKGHGFTGCGKLGVLKGHDFSRAASSAISMPA